MLLLCYNWRLILRLRGEVLEDTRYGILQLSLQHPYKPGPRRAKTKSLLILELSGPGPCKYGFFWQADSKVCPTWETRFDPWVSKIPEGNSYPSKHSWLENFMNKGTW